MKGTKLYCVWDPDGALHYYTNLALALSAARDIAFASKLKVLVDAVWVAPTDRDFRRAKLYANLLNDEQWCVRRSTAAVVKPIIVEREADDGWTEKRVDRVEVERR